MSTTLAPPLTATRCRAARAALGWPVRKLSLASKVPITDIVHFEQGLRVPPPRSLTAIRVALEAAGVELIEESGDRPRVKLREPSGHQR